MKHLSAVLFLALAPTATGCLDFQRGVAGDPDPGGDPSLIPPHVCGDGTRTQHEVCVTATSIDAPAGASDARLVDLDGDGHLDLIYMTPHYAVMRLGDGHGGFAAETHGLFVDGAQRLAYGDVDADGTVDLVTAAGGTIEVWRRSSDGTYASVATLANQLPIVDLAVGDTDGHPGDEIAYVDALGYGVRKYTGAAKLDTFTTQSLVVPPAGLVLADIGGSGLDGPADGLGDGVMVGRDALPIVIFSSADGIVHSTLGAGGSSDGLANAGRVAVAAADLAGDGVDDVVTATSNPPGLATWSHAHGTHASAAGVLPPIAFLDHGDLDGDGRADVVAGSIDPPWVTTVFGATGSGAGGLVPGDHVVLPAVPTALHVDGDVNGDGIADPIVTSSDRIVILMSEAP